MIDESVLRLPPIRPTASTRSRISSAPVTTCSPCERSSKLYGLAGLRVGYGVGPAAVIAAIRKVQRGYDVGTLAQGRRARKPRGYGRGGAATGRERIAVADLTELLRARGLEPHRTARRTSSSSRSEPMRTRSPPRCSPRASACSRGRRSGRRRHCGSVRARRPISSARCSLSAAGFLGMVQRGLTPASPGGAAEASAILNRGARRLFLYEDDTQKAWGRVIPGTATAGCSCLRGQLHPSRSTGGPTANGMLAPRARASSAGVHRRRGLRRRCRRRAYLYTHETSGRRGGPQHRREGNREEARHPRLRASPPLRS